MREVTRKQMTDEELKKSVKEWEVLANSSNCSSLQLHSFIFQSPMLCVDLGTDTKGATKKDLASSTRNTIGEARHFAHQQFLINHSQDKNSTAFQLLKHSLYECDFGEHYKGGTSYK